MIDMNKTYTFKGRPVRLYSDGSDTRLGKVHCAVKRPLDGKCVPIECRERYLVEVLEPQREDLCYFWNNKLTPSITIRKFGNKDKDGKYPYVADCSRYKFCAPFKGELPPDFKGLYKMTRLEFETKIANMWKIDLVLIEEAKLNLEITTEYIQSLEKHITELESRIADRHLTYSMPFLRLIDKIYDEFETLKSCDSCKYVHETKDDPNFQGLSCTKTEMWDMEENFYCSYYELKDNK